MAMVTINSTATIPITAVSMVSGGTCHTKGVSEP